DEENRRKIEVRDRRHWVRKEGGNGEGAPPGAEEPSLLPTYVERLEARAREQEDRLRSFMEQQRAENEAFRERVRRDAGRRAEDARAELVKDLVGVLDDLERALASGRTASDLDPKSILEGVRLVHGRLLSTLQARGLERVPSEGMPFDPNVHEAVGTVAVEDPQRENLVVEEVLPGYLQGGRLLRPARVRVAKAARSESPEGQESP
ncbi:MAG: nucleotide exchange factor GrpE, partial [Nitrospinota bacterium]